MAFAVGQSQEVLQPLLTILETKTEFRCVVNKITELKAELKEEQQYERKILGAMERICSLIYRPSFHPDPSEGDIVHHWKDVFAQLLDGTEIFMQSGERVSKSSKAAKLIMDEEFKDSGKYGRKVDLLFHVGDQELSNFEFKVGGVSPNANEVQRLKNVRLNRAIMEENRRSLTTSLSRKKLES
ncbi:hypothetical protein BGZ65_011468 [Modicella reniformis]|uniref:Uncharacterized protein n=1 Tax=Modicella reniformis TaxID=1440133 RepID=A0A9P6J3Z0_9FUNG|nr:hypothetical protein BGZ65_011468 [Modicella reniformis]